MYAKVIAGVVQVYPYSLTTLYADNPNVSFPAVLTPALLAQYDIYAVVMTGQPVFDPALQKAVEITPTFVGGFWTQTWSVVALSAPEQQAYKDQFVIDAKVETVRYMDAFAATRDYADTDRCCGFSSSADLDLAGDAAAMSTNRDAVVASAYATLLQIQTGAIPVPTMAAFLATLPAMTWANPPAYLAITGTAVL